MFLMVMFALGTMAAPMATATRVDVAQLLAAIDIPARKATTGDSSWCDNCVCTKSIPPYCSCSVASLCPKCVCYLTVSTAFQKLCESLATKLVNFCPPIVTTTERT
ncbi:uncharacterized protein LOC122646585 [Telopea speciosissima]|uniref:uncharacterized protein LOC122646585 n=1 Tax=Telopea speciosissima TaxID=54955 RepID=UPI001CC5A82D|nr:uncharacterized protein LOC122646585 [Telopea speciosissima]